MKVFTISLTLVTSCFLAKTFAQSQVVTPDNQVVSFQSVNGTSNLFIGQSTSAVIGGI